MDTDLTLLSGDPPTKEIPLHSAFYDTRTGTGAVAQPADNPNIPRRKQARGVIHIYGKSCKWPQHSGFFAVSNAAFGLVSAALLPYVVAR